MITENEKQHLIQFVNKIGYDIGVDMEQNVQLLYQKSFDFLPEMAMFISSYIVKKTFTRQTTAPKFIKNCICFFFVNMFDEGERTKNNQQLKPQKAYVHIFPYTHTHKSVFKMNAHIRNVSVIISADYLKSFLIQDVDQFSFLFEEDNNFLIEEIMTDDILRTVNDIVKGEEPTDLKDFHYKLKAMELLFYLIQSLNKRGKSVYQKLSENDLTSIYKVRDKLVASLPQSSTIEELRQIAGMNELKMRKLFMQVFGMGIYDYYQHLRMKEAARLLREGTLSVSEVGYQMGFENLSHFSRVFEKHIGKKPKKYSKEFMLLE